MERQKSLIFAFLMTPCLALAGAYNPDYDYDAASRNGDNFWIILIAWVALAYWLKSLDDK